MQAISKGVSPLWLRVALRLKAFKALQRDSYRNKATQRAAVV